MWDFDFGALKPAEKVLFVLLAVSAVAATATFVMVTIKVILEYLGYRRAGRTEERVEGLIAVARDIFKADAQVRAEITSRTRRAEVVAEGTHVVLKDLQQKAEKVERASEVAKEAAEKVKEVVVSNPTLTHGGTPGTGPTPP